MYHMGRAREILEELARAWIWDEAQAYEERRHRLKNLGALESVRNAVNFGDCLFWAVAKRVLHWDPFRHDELTISADSAWMTGFAQFTLHRAEVANFAWHLLFVLVFSSCHCFVGKLVLLANGIS